MPTAPPTIVAIPDPPSTADPANFDARGDAFLGVFPALRDALEALGLNVYENAEEVYNAALDISAAVVVASNAAGLAGKSNSPLTVGAGAKSITLLVAKPDLVELNRRVVLVNRTDPSIRMFGTISNVTSSSIFVVTVVSSGSFGSGNYSTWHVIDGAFFGAAATKETVWAATDDTAQVTSKTLGEAGKPVSVAFAAPLVLNFGAGVSFVVGSATANFQLANPTGITAEMVGRSGSITLPQDGTGGRLISYGTYWKPSAAHQPLSTGASKSDTLYYEIKSLTRIEYNVVRDYLP